MRWPIGIRKAVNYGLLLVFLIIILPLSSRILNHYQEVGAINYRFLPFYLAQLTMYSLVGIVLGLFDRVIAQFRKPGKWRFDLVRFIILGLPCLYASLSCFIFWLPIQSVITNFVLNLRAPVLSIVQVLTGYIFVTCFHKTSVIERYSDERANIS